MIEFAGDDEVAILARQADRFAASGVDAADDLFVDGTLTIETIRKRELIFVKLTAAEVRALLRFFAELPALPKEK